MTKATEDTATKQTPEEIEAKRKALIAELDALPPPPAPPGARPGTIIGEGYSADKVPFTKEWFLDVESRRKDAEFAGGYELHEVWASEDITVSVQGVGFRVLPGRKCWLPTPHWQVFQERAKLLQDLQARYNPPDGGPKPMQVYRIDGPWKKDPITE